MPPYKPIAFTVNKTTKKILLNYILAPALMCILLWLIYKQVQLKGGIREQLNDLKEQWQAGNKILLAIVFMLAPVNWLLESAKWKMLLQKIEPVSLLKAFASTLTGISFSMITPNKIGDFAGRILYLNNKNKLRAAIAVLVSNLSQTIVTYIFGIAGLIFFYVLYPGRWPLLALGGALISALLLAFLYIRIDLVAQWAQNRQWLRKIVIPLQVLKRYSRRNLISLLLISLVRFCVYTFQFLLLINLLGADVPWITGFFISGLMFWMITVIPSFFLADLGVRGFVAGLLFIDTALAANSITILAASYTIWLLNLVLPALIGSVLIVTARIAR